MNKLSKISLAGAGIILCFLATVLIIKGKNSGKIAYKKILAATGPDTGVTHTFSAVNNLYDLRHPYLTKGDRLNDERKYDSAIYYYREALVKFKKDNHWDNYVHMNGYIGRLYLYVAGENYQDAWPYLQEALDKGKQHLNAGHPYLSTIYYYLGLYYYKEKMAGKSLEMHNKALKILLKNYKNDNVYIADVYDALGDVYYNLLFDLITAEKNYVKAVRIKEMLPDEEKKSVLTPSYYNLVNLNFSMGDLEKAQSFCYEAIKNAPYVKSYNAYWEELLEGVLANIYTEQKIYDQAIVKLKNVIRLNSENKGDKSYLAFYYTSLGDIYSVTSKYDTAIELYKKALVLTQVNGDALFSDQKEQVAATNYSLGMTFIKVKNYSTAVRYLRKSLDLYLKIFGGKNYQTAIAFEGIGDAYQQAGSPDSALKYFQAGIIACTMNFIDSTIYKVPLMSNVDKNFYSFLIIRDKAMVLKKLYASDTSNGKLLHSSLAHYCLADSLMSLFRSVYSRENAKLAFNNNNNNIYEEAIDCAALLYHKTGEGRYFDLMFDFMDKRKSSLLLEALNQKEVLQQAGIPVTEQKLLISSQQELAYLQGELEKENGKENPEESTLQILHARINGTEQKFNSLDQNLVKRYPLYASIQQWGDTIHVKDAQSFSKKSNSVILEYFWGDKAVYVLGIYNDNRRVLKISRSNEFDGYLDTLRRNLSRGYVFATRENDFMSFQKNSYYIFNSLVRPILSLLTRLVKENSNTPRIIIIPDGVLSDIPFEVLVTLPAAGKEVNYRKIEYLINNYVISYEHSTRFLLKNNHHQNTVTNPRVLGLSYSKEQEPKSNLGKLSKLKADDNGELPGSAKELKAISTYMKGDFYMGDDATEYKFKNEAPGYDILHLAIHGEANNRNSYNSRLIFKKGTDSLNDGYLYAYEIYNLPLRAKLAVLSACESGIGKLHPGEGMYSMARAFVYAGCQCVIMSYWRVNDNSTRTVMSAFYRQISAGAKIDQSLRKAKLEYINNADRRNAHPANWAAFIAIGNMEPLVMEAYPDKATVTASIIVVIIIIAAAGYLLSREKVIKNFL